VFLFINDGRGKFKAQLVWGSTNDDFGSSWITATDLDKDGDVDFLYSNGDAFDYAPPSGRPWHGVQWIENRGHLEFAVHRIADFSGASSPQPIDMDADGDLDVAVVSAYNAWSDPAAQSLIWLENDGQMRFTSHDLANAPTHLVTLSVGDFTGDGLPDLVTGGMHINRPYDRLSRITLWTNGKR
jgi:FG-GAP-like repeat